MRQSPFSSHNLKNMSAHAISYPMHQLTRNHEKVPSTRASQVLLRSKSIYSHSHHPLTSQHPLNSQTASATPSVHRNSYRDLHPFPPAPSASTVPDRSCAIYPPLRTYALFTSTSITKSVRIILFLTTSVLLQPLPLASNSLSQV